MFIIAALNQIDSQMTEKVFGPEGNCGSRRYNCSAVSLKKIKNTYTHLANSGLLQKKLKVVDFLCFWRHVRGTDQVRSCRHKLPGQVTVRHYVQRVQLWPLAGGNSWNSSTLRQRYFPILHKSLFP